MILTALDKHHSNDLDSKWKRHIKRMFKNITNDDYIRARYYEFKEAKPDILRLIMEDKNENCDSICFNSLIYISCARNLSNPLKYNIKINWPILSKYFYDEDFLKKYG